MAVVLGWQRDGICLPSLSWCGSWHTQRWQAGIQDRLVDHGGLAPLCKKAADLGCNQDTGLAGCRHAAACNGCLFPHAPTEADPLCPALPGSQSPGSRSVRRAPAHAVAALGYSSTVTGSAASSHPKLITLQSFQGTPTLRGS